MAIREAGTNKVTLVGIFDRIFGPGFPLQHLAPVAIYARLMDAEGEYPIRIDLVRLDDEMTIGRAELTATITDRMSTHEVVVNFASGILVFEQPGAYEWRLFANGRHVGGLRMVVVQVDQPQGGPS